MTTSDILRGYLYKGTIYYGDTKPIVYLYNGVEIVSAHPFMTSDYVKDLNYVEGPIEFYYDSGEFIPQESFERIK